MKNFISSGFLESILVPLNKIEKNKFMIALEENYIQFKTVIMTSLIIFFILYKFLINVHNLIFNSRFYLMIGNYLFNTPWYIVEIICYPIYFLQIFNIFFTIKS